MAEREGFEPPIRCRIPDFESGAFDHSAISPTAGNYTRVGAAAGDPPPGARLAAPIRARPWFASMYLQFFPDQVPRNHVTTVRVAGAA